MGRLFGTDGVRGVANTELTNEIAYRLGQAAVVFLGKTIIIGKDTRLSGDMLEAAMISGITSAGGTALIAGIVPTPALPIVIRKLNAAGGAMISASHNPPEYNGIKLFDSRGLKLDDDFEDRIEEFITSGGLETKVDTMPTGSDVGFPVKLADSVTMYIDHVVGSIQDQNINFQDFVVALDTGHGASSLTSHKALEQLGCEVHAINEDFDGMDINVECGSTHLEPLKELVSQTGADIGIAHDGDADRVMLVDSMGNEIDGDIMEAVIAVDLKDRGLLNNNTVVTTVMSNLGLVRAMEDAGIDVVQTKVGDRYLLEEMIAHDYSIGAEQSGHVIISHYNTTGDGLMTAVQFMAAVKRRGNGLDEATHVITKYPQVLINVPVTDKDKVLADSAVRQSVEDAENDLDKSGRVLLRPSGTEPVVRVMVEAADEHAAKKHAEAIAKAIEAVR